MGEIFFQKVQKRPYKTEQIFIPNNNFLYQMIIFVPNDDF